MHSPIDGSVCHEPPENGLSNGVVQLSKQPVSFFITVRQKLFCLWVLIKLNEALANIRRHLGSVKTVPLQGQSH